MIKRDKKHLDIVLTNNTDPILNVCVYNKIKQMHSLDHDPFNLKLNASDWFKVERPILEKRESSFFSSSKADWKHTEAQIETRLFLQYYYNNVNLMLDHWDERLFNIFKEKIPKKTKHRVSLPQWLSRETSNLIKRKNTQKKIVQRKPSESNQTKLTLMQNLVTEKLNDNQRAYDESKTSSKTVDSVKCRSILKASKNLYCFRTKCTWKEKEPYFSYKKQSFLTSSSSQHNHKQAQVSSRLEN